MADVFVSYTRSDAELVRRLANELRKSGVSVFLDADSIAPGDSIMNSLSRAISDAKVAVLVAPEHRRPSEFVRLETSAALSRGEAGDLLVLPVVLPGRTPDSEFEKFRYLYLKSVDDLAPLVEVVINSLRPKSPPRQSAARLRLAFLTSLIRSDLGLAPVAAAIVLDEINQSLGSVVRGRSAQIEVLRETQSWGRENLGPSHPAVRSLTFRLTDVLTQAGRYSEALDVTYEIIERSVNDSDSLAARINLGHLLAAMGDLERADDQYHQALRDAYRLDLRSSAASVLLSLGGLARRRGDSESATKHYEQSLSISNDTADAPNRAAALVELADVSLERGNRELTVAYATDGLALAESTMGPDAPTTKRARSILARSDA